MQKRKLLIISGCILAMLLVVMLLSTAGTDPKPAAAAEAFSCYTADARGNTLLGHWSEENGVWYLFATSTQSVADTKLYYTGSVSACSAGFLDEENQVVSGAFRESGDCVELEAPDGTVNRVVVMQSDLPSVCIDLKETTLEELHQDKEAKHGGNSIRITDPAGEYDFSAENCMEIKGRGNSTWTFYEKRGYQIRFEQKVSLMGMSGAKKWVLLANAGDDSLMRSQLVYEMARKLDMEFVPSFAYVDLWIDGDYRGTYLLGEKVEIDVSRLNLTDYEAMIFEHDEGFYAEEEHWFYSEMLDRHFSLKDIRVETDGNIEDAVSDFESAVNALAAYLYETPSEAVTLERLSEMIDVDSFAKYYLVNEYVLNRESFVSSFYWYMDGPEDVIHLGPVWDFDSCMGGGGEAWTDYFGDDHVLFRYLLSAPAFYQRTQELLEACKPELAAMAENAEGLRAQIGASAEMNYLRWDVLGEPNPKGGADFHAGFDEAVDAVREWLLERAEVFQIPQCEAVFGMVSGDGSQMELSYRTDRSYQDITFAVWSLEDGQDDMTWYSAQQDEDGVWRCSVDLSEHSGKGLYYIHAYGDDVSGLAAYGLSYVH